MNVGQALAAARAAGVARLDAQLLLAHHLQQPRAWLVAHDDAELPPAAEAAFRAGLTRRAGGEPLAYVLGRCSFRGLDLAVTPAVLVPRPETEGLVEWALEHLQAGQSVADLGTGSGALALALARACPGVDITATDASPAALAVARANAQRLALAVAFVEGDWWVPLTGRRFDVVVSNPPYVAGDDPHLQALTHEPRAALTPEGDGMAALRRIVAGAPAHLVAGGWLLLEHGHDQGPAVRELLQRHGFSAIETRDDLAGLARCSGGCLADAATGHS